MTLGEKIQKLRQERNLSQKGLADKLDITTGTIAEWESDEVIPSLSEIVTLSQIFNITTDQLIKDMDTLDKCQDISNSSTPQPNKQKKPTKPRHIKRIVGIIVAVSIVILGVAVFLLRDNISTLFPSPTPTPEEIYNTISPSTVEISGDAFYFTSTGTGFFIDDKGTVITNFHVIKDCFDAKITLLDGTEHPVLSVLGYDEDLDVAILSTGCAYSNPLEFREEPVETGEKAYTLGSSLGLTGTFAEGVISSASRKIGGKNFIQTTAPISSGNSGGPLVDKEGKVVGITTAAFEEGQNLNLAVPIVLALNIDRKNDYSMIQSFLDKYDLAYIERRMCELFLDEDMDKETRLKIKDILDNATLK